MNLRTLSNVESVLDFNKTASALFRENDISISSEEDFESLFPDQVNQLTSFGDFLEKMKTLKFTDEFVNIIKEYDKNFDRIIIASDYDADGITSATILINTFKNIGFKDVSFFIPDRLKGHYGIDINAMSSFISNNSFNGRTLLITTDTGISEKETIETLIKDFKVDVIITDHHIPTEGCVPEGARLIIDPKYNNDEFSDICAGFVALKLSYALSKEFNTDFNVELASLAGIATITDMMPMLNENRYIVKLTLDAMNIAKETKGGSYPFLYKVMRSLGGYNFTEDLNAVATEDLISFYIGPAINAVSRVEGNVTNLVNDLIDSLEHPWKFIPFYNNKNFTRKEQTKEILDKYEYDPAYVNSSVFLFNPNDFSYPIKGIIGLIANKVSNLKNVVAFMGYESAEGLYEFSARAMPGYNLHDGVERIKLAHPELEIDGGGHAAAMGVRFKASPENLKAFKDYLEEDVINNKKEIETNVYLFDDEIADEIINTYQALQPFGNGFKKCKFIYTGLFKSYDSVNKLAYVGDYMFKLYISQADVSQFIGKEYTAIFTIGFDDKYSITFNIVRE